MNNLAETKKCTNCKLDILSSNYTIHSLHCIKNIYLCVKCEQPVNYIKKSDHDQMNHTFIGCSNCNKKVEKYLLGDHLKNDCPYRKIKCSFCDIEVTAKDLSEHENYCGSRTEKCSECGLFVMLKCKTLHIESNHTFFKLSDEAGPSPSWQNGRRTLYNFMPDLSSKTPKSVADLKRASSEFDKKLRNLELTESNNDSLHSGAISRNFDSVYEKKDKVYRATNNLSKIKDSKTPSKSVDEWPALMSLKSLQISEEKKNNSRSETEDSDLSSTTQLSRDLNSHIWFKDSNGKDEALKNCFQLLTENHLSAEKVMQKNMFDKNVEKEGAQFEVNINRNYLDDIYEEQEKVKLPCEFCGSLIVSNELLLHQSRCSLNLTEFYNTRSTRHTMPYFDEIDEINWEKKISCGNCNKVFKSSLFESHELRCRRNQDRGCNLRNIRTKNVKCELGIQNGVEPNSPTLNRAGTHSEWLSEFSKSTEGRKDLKNSFECPETGTSNKTVKASKKSRRPPSPPRN